MATPIVFQWQPGSYSGWGVIGINLLLEWSGDTELAALTLVPFDPNSLVLDGLRRRRIDPLLSESRRLQEVLLRPHAGMTLQLSCPVLQALGNGLDAGLGVHGVTVRGTPTIAMPVFEDTRIPPRAVENARAYPLFVTGSRWNEQVLRRAGIDWVRNVWQGIDPTLFHPAPRRGWYGDRFVVFSGGKVEIRKAQDIVLRAFRAFAQRHPESLLVTAWQSPWPEFARAFGDAQSVAPVPFTADGRIDVTGWAAANGIAAEQVIDIGHVPNALMPTVFREMDVALFPSRCEGGTNLVAMEAMACGVPCILSRNTGHLDLIDGDACHALERQTPFGSAEDGTEGWGESDVEEAVEALESVWRDREQAAARGAGGAAMMRERSWAAQARELRDAIALAAGW